MSDRHEQGEAPTPEELAAAERLDALIDVAQTHTPLEATHEGHDADGLDDTSLWLVGQFQAPVPAGLKERVTRRLVAAARAGRAWTATRVMAAALAALFIFQGSSNLTAGEWVARGLGEPHSPHAFTEAGLAFIAIGVAVAAGALRRVWLPVAVTVGVPLGLVLGIRGVGEIEQFAAGAALHLSQGLAGLGLLAGWLAMRRYRHRATDEEQA